MRTLTAALTCCTLVLLALFFPELASAAGAPAAAGVASQQSLGSEVANFFNYANNASQSLSAHLITNECYAILAAVVGWRILMVTIPALLEGDLSNWAGELLKIIIVTSIIVSVFANWNGGPLNIRQQAHNAFSEITNIVVASEPAGVTNDGGCLTPPAGQNDGITSVVTMAFDAFSCSTGKLVAVAVDQFNVPISQGSGWGWDHALSVVGAGLSHIIAVFVMIVLVGVLVVVFVIATIEALMAWAHVIVPLTLGPVVIAFYPVNTGWTSSVISSIVAGFLAYAASLFVMLIILSVFTDAMSVMTTYMQSVTQAGNGVGVGNFMGTIIGQMAALALIGIVFAYAGSAFTSAASGLVGSNDHFSRHRGMMAGAVAGATAGMAARLGGKALGEGSAGVAKGVGRRAMSAGKAGISGSKNLATGHTAGKLAGIKAQRSARDAATASSNASRNAGVYTPPPKK